MLTSADINVFSRWSLDKNPLHIDENYAARTAFKRNVVQGICVLLKASQQISQINPPSNVRVDFTKPFLVDDEFTVERGESEKWKICKNGSAAFLLSLGHAEIKLNSNKLEKLEHNTVVRAEAASRAPDNLPAGTQIVGTWPIREVPAEFQTSCFTELQSQILACCSYLVGMEIPGESALFTHLSLEFQSFER